MYFYISHKEFEIFITEHSFIKSFHYKSVCSLSTHLPLFSTITTIPRSQLITAHAMRVQSPPHQGSATIDVTLTYKSKHFCKDSPGKFHYTGLFGCLDVSVFVRLRSSFIV